MGRKAVGERERIEIERRELCLKCSQERNDGGGVRY